MFQFKDYIRADNGCKKYVSRKLFRETNFDKDYKPTFNMTPEDDEETYSFEKIYLSLNDPTEYRIITEIFNGDARNWEVVRSSTELAEFFDKCRDKLMKKLQSEAFSKIMGLAFDDGNKNQMSALKILYDIKPVKTAGRPKKEKKVEEIDTTDLLEDIKRLKE